MFRKGYKATYHGKSKYNIILYEVGKEYKINSVPILNWHGFHYCENPKSVLNYYEFNYKFCLFEIEDLSDISKKNWDETVTNHFIVKRKIEYPELAKLFNWKLLINSPRELEIKSFGFYYHVVFDENNNLLLEESKNGLFSPTHWTKLQYDDLGREIRYMNSNGLHEIYSYNETGEQLRHRCLF